MRSHPPQLISGDQRLLHLPQHPYAPTFLNLKFVILNHKSPLCVSLAPRRAEREPPQNLAALGKSSALTPYPTRPPPKMANPLKIWPSSPLFLAIFPPPRYALSPILPPHPAHPIHPCFSPSSSLCVLCVSVIVTYAICGSFLFQHSLPLLKWVALFSHSAIISVINNPHLGSATITRPRCSMN